MQHHLSWSMKATPSTVGWIFKMQCGQFSYVLVLRVDIRLQLMLCISSLVLPHCDRFSHSSTTNAFNSQNCIKNVLNLRPSLAKCTEHVVGFRFWSANLFLEPKLQLFLRRRLFWSYSKVSRDMANMLEIFSIPHCSLNKPIILANFSNYSVSGWSLLAALVYIIYIILSTWCAKIHVTSSTITLCSLTPFTSACSLGFNAYIRNSCKTLW